MCTTITQPWVCAIVAVGAVLWTLYTIYPSSSRKMQRDIEDLSAKIHSNQLPAGDCSTTICMLKAGAVDGDWMAFGNITINGAFHDVHFQKNGTMLALKAIQQSASTSTKRAAADDTDDDDGIVAAYFWENDDKDV